MINGHSQADLLAHIECRYEELLEGLCELEERVSTTLEVVTRRRPTIGGQAEGTPGTSCPEEVAVLGGSFAE
jgi:hypothetical protein